MIRAHMSLLVITRATSSKNWMPNPPGKIIKIARPLVVCSADRPEPELAEGHPWCNCANRLSTMLLYASRQLVATGHSKPCQALRRDIAGSPCYRHTYRQVLFAQIPGNLVFFVTLSP
jgi:hypothetical protein